MKTLVVYYSRSGHTHQVAREIATRCGADLEAIREPGQSATATTGAVGYLRASWQALCRAAPAISPALKDPADYDLVIIGTPIWVYGLAPPVRSYAQQYVRRFKRVAFFCTEGGSGDQKAFDELARLCGKKPVATFAVTEKELPEPAHSEPLRGFVSRLVAG
jgi:flavodoxin